MCLLARSKSVFGLNQVNCVSLVVSRIYSNFHVGEVENDSIEFKNTFSNVCSAMILLKRAEWPWRERGVMLQTSEADTTKH